MTGTVDGRRVVARQCARSWASTASILRRSPPRPTSCARDGATAIFVGVDGRLAGIIAIADPVKADDRRGARQRCRADGMRIVMLTGDNRTTAEAVARRLGIDEVEAEVLPDGQDARSSAAEGARAASSPWPATASTTRPALAAADVGIAMGTGTDVAIESAGVTLVKGDLTRHRAGAAAVGGDDAQHPAEPVLRLRLQRRSACRSPPACSTRSSASCSRPLIAAAAMALSSVSVIGNALRLRAVRL